MHLSNQTRCRVGSNSSQQPDNQNYEVRLRSTNIVHEKASLLLTRHFLRYVDCGIPFAGATASIKFSRDDKFAQIESTDMEAAAAEIAAAVARHHILAMAKGHFTFPLSEKSNAL